MTALEGVLAGPWDDEPDRIEWVSASGRPCLMLRNNYWVWCGYALADDETVADSRVTYNLDVHGGVTFAGRISEAGWWIGFDCGHWMDRVPTMPGSFRHDTVYRDVAYVRDQVEKLAAQLDCARPQGQQT